MFLPRNSKLKNRHLLISESWIMEHPVSLSFFLLINENPCVNLVMLRDAKENQSPSSFLLPSIGDRIVFLDHPVFPYLWRCCWRSWTCKSTDSHPSGPTGRLLLFHRRRRCVVCVMCICVLSVFFCAFFLCTLCGGSSFTTYTMERTNATDGRTK